MTVSTSVEATVLEILSDVLNEPPEDLNAKTILAAHGWDSIVSLEALAQLESRLGITLDLRSFHDAHTIAEMAELVKNAVNLKARVQ